MMDGTSHNCESCGGECDCERNVDIEPCAFCVDCNIEWYDDWDCWYEELE